MLTPATASLVTLGLLGLGPSLTNAATLSLKVHFTENELSSVTDWSSANLFGISYHSCENVMGTTECPGAHAIYNHSYYVKTSDKVATDKWVKDYDLGSVYTGPISFSFFAPMPFTVSEEGNVTFMSSITKCVEDPANYGMSLELCGAVGSSYSFSVTDPLATYTFDVYPSFGLGETGTTSVLLPQFYSSQLNVSRDIPVYIPPSLLQNRVSRPVNIMFVMDGSLSAVDSYAKRTGFEAGQLQGQVPESIMIGITTEEMFYANILNAFSPSSFDQRTYEMTYEQALEWPTGSCIDGFATGGAPLLLQWLDEDVVPAVLALIGDAGMERGEVGMTGGSLGGLTSCYAAASRPDFVQRAVCSSPSSCFNYGSGGLAPLITSEHARHGLRPKTVIQFQGQEIYDESLDSLQGDETIYTNFVNDDTAWKNIGMESLSPTRSYVPADAGNPYGYTIMDEPANSVVMSFIVQEGQHMASTWEQEFAAALPHLYRADRPDKLRNSFLERLKFLSATDPTEEDALTEENVVNNDDDENAMMVIVVTILSVLLVATVAIIGGLIMHMSKLYSKLDSKLLSESPAKL